MDISMWHVSDRELLLAADRELTPAQERRLLRHLSGCPHCAARAGTVRRDPLRMLADAEARVATLPAAAPARARLRMRLADVSQEAAIPFGTVRRWAAVCALLVLTAGLMWSMPARQERGVSESSVAAAPVFLLPRADLTPGLALPVTAADLCGDDRPVARPVAPAVQRGVFARYGADVARAPEYELDYLITPELGGAPDPRNLWPQPFGRTIWNAYVKDELELQLHHMVCAGTIDLATAQRELAGDWIAAYKARFQTDRPRRDYAASPLTGEDTAFLRAELAEMGIEAPAGAMDGPGLLALLQASRQDAWR